jgi:hypothetical protein
MVKTKEELSIFMMRPYHRINVEEGGCQKAV